MATPTPAAVAVALVRFGRVEPRKKSAGLLSSIINEEVQRIEGSEGEDVKRNLDLDLMVLPSFLCKLPVSSLSVIAFVFMCTFAGGRHRLRTVLPRDSGRL